MRGLETDRGERLVDAAAPLDAPDAAEEERQLDVPRRGQARHQMEELEDEADLLAADAGELLVGERADLVAVETVGAGAGSIEAADDVEQRRLARPRRSHDRDVLAIGDGLVDAGQRVDRLVADDEGAPNAGELDHGGGGPPPD